MSEPAVPRNRWRRAMVIVPLVILIAGGGIWWWFSRLNSVEKVLVGEWKVVNPSNSHRIVRFNSDRTATGSNAEQPDDPGEECRWFVRGNQLTVIAKAIPFHKALSEWVRSGFRVWETGREVHSIQILSPDHVVVIDHETGPGTTPVSELFRMESRP